MHKIDLIISEAARGLMKLNWNTFPKVSYKVIVILCKILQIESNLVKN